MSNEASTSTSSAKDTFKLPTNIDKCAEYVAKAKRVVVFSGAGMSAESGIDTFRGSSGLWTGVIGTVVLGYFGTPVGWKITPGLCWSQYIDKFYKPIAKANPNPGHYALAELEKIVPHFRIITQNVDGLHQRAGNNSNHVYEVHGTVRRHKCVTNGHIYDFGTQTDLPTTSPKCKKPGCTSTLRPDCVLFTESLPMDDWSYSAKAVMGMKPGDVMLIIGTSAKVYPAAGLPEEAANRGAILIDLNLAPTNFKTLPNYNHLAGPSGKVLPALVERVKALQAKEAESKV